MKNRKLAGLVLLSVLAMPLVGSAAGNSVVANSTVPVLDGVVAGRVDIDNQIKNIMNVTQQESNAIIKWKDFSIGANATVSFNKNGGGEFNTLNYVSGSSMSQLYGKLNATGGNIFLVNPNGVQIGNSAQINVGSLHVANKKIDKLEQWTNGNFTQQLSATKNLSNAELMSLGYINAGKLTFEGKRVVLDLDRISGLKEQQDALKIVSIRDDLSGDFSTTKKDNRLYDVVLGTSDVSDANLKAWEKKISFANVMEPEAVYAGSVKAENPDRADESITQFFSYRWIKDGRELGSIGREAGWDLDGHYALRYAIDLTGSSQAPIGTSAAKAFTGKFDGLNNNIFGLSIDNSDNSKGEATGLFGFTNGAAIANFNLIAGTDGVSIKGGATDTGALIGHAVNTKVTKVASTLKVEGQKNVGGLIGSAEYMPTSDSSKQSLFRNLINTGNVSGKENVGGLIGSMTGGTLGVGETSASEDEQTHNLGKVTGINAGTATTLPDNTKAEDYFSHNIGGLVGLAQNAVIGAVQKNGADYINNTNALYNAATVEGGYNVGGLVGSASGTSILNAANESRVLATGYIAEDYIYHTAYTKNGFKNVDPKKPLHKASVRMANAGGIVGNVKGDGLLLDVKNSGNIEAKEIAGADASASSDKPGDFTHYGAGNVGGIAGRVEDTNITNAKNSESNIRGAMNVGGIAGYFGSSSADKTYRISKATNDGGDIMATGGLHATEDAFTKEITHPDANDTNGEIYITGNIGGIAGYLDGSAVRIAASDNRGSVHSATIKDMNKILTTAKAANVGGIVGKLDRETTLSVNERLSLIKQDENNASVAASSNTGAVSGFANVGGIGGFAYNGSITTSYNLGKINTTRKAGTSGTQPTNMGGILGDSTEQTAARVVLYDVYNKGEIGDSTYNLYARHVGGIAGRLSGTIEKAYNTGNIFNGYNVVGGITGYWYTGDMKNVFNTGNITVVNNNGATSNVGGIAGVAYIGSGAETHLTNAYNLGSLRSFKGVGDNKLGGIIGCVSNFGGPSYRLTINNVYTGGNLYVDSGGNLNAVVGGYYNNNTSLGSYVSTNNAYYIRPVANNGYTNIATPNATAIDFNSKYDKSKYGGFDFSSQTDGTISVGEGKNLEDTWRMVDGNGLPILNAFLPGSHAYFSQQENWNKFKDNNALGKVIYGTAYDPMLTLINSQKDLTFNWADMNLKNSGALAVFGVDGAKPDLTLNDVHITNSTGIFGGLLYSDGALTLNSKAAQDIYLGAGAQLFGSSVNLNTDGKLTLAGTVTATGNKQEANQGIQIKAGELNVYGRLTTAEQGKTTTVAGIGEVNASEETSDAANVKNKNAQMTDIGLRFSHTTTEAAAKNSDLSITITKNMLSDGTVTSGAANILYGNLQTGKAKIFGDLSIASEGKILVDTDLQVNGRLSLDAKNSVGTTNEAVLDISHLGGGTAEAIQNFLGVHSDAEHGVYGTNVRIALDAWNAQKQFAGDSQVGNFDYAQFDTTASSFGDQLAKLYVQTDGKTYGAGNEDIHKVFYTWISSAEQLSAIQHYAEHSASGYKEHILEHNFMLKNDLDGSELQSFASLGRGTQGFTGVLDGRDQRLIGFTASNGLLADNAGTVKNMHIYSSVFTGSNGSEVGAVAAKNSGSIENITGLGNTIKGDSNNKIGGLVGTNTGWLQNSSDQSTVIAGAGTTAGGLVGVNVEGFISNVQSNSAVTTDFAGDGSKFAQNLGGIAGANITEIGFGGIDDASVHGVTGKSQTTKISGGIVGSNKGIIENAYNESIVHGSENLGGIAGINAVSAAGDHAYISSVANALEIIGDEGSTNVGGLVGSQTDGAVLDNGRNTGVVQGTTNVGGFVGSNGAGSSMSNLENAPQASVIGKTNVGGIAGSNAGRIIVDTSGLRNEGQVYGVENVGGTVGYNKGTGIVKNINSNMELFVNGAASDAKYFGGVVGKNEGKVINAINSGSMRADGAEYVGGIIGLNMAQDAFIDEDGSTSSEFVNNGNVSGKNFVGGIIGLNQTTALDGVTATNKGSVTATAGGAGGIFGKYTGSISNSTLTNEGNVSGNGSVSAAGELTGTGGITGVNSGAIINSVLCNSGKVHNTGSSNNVGGIFGVKAAGDIVESSLINQGVVAGNENVGGLIGLNKVSISYSNLTNEIEGRVVGLRNVGGLVGANSGSLAGARDVADNYYKYQVYNNGVIASGSMAADGSLLAAAGENIGGLVGTNTGSLAAAYNTGVLAAGGSTNVGGIVGNNSGNVDQVFNTVAVRSGSAGAYSWSEGTVTGAQNVGGLIGANAGSLTNAYNTTTVNGDTNVGSIAGFNSGTISKTCDSKAQAGQQLVGGGTAAGDSYSHKAGTVQAKQPAGYASFDFNGTTWKIYTGYSSPLLKIFLTKVGYDASKDNQRLVYDGSNLHKNLEQLIKAGALRDLSGRGFAADKNSGTSLINNDAAQTVDVGSYLDLLWSLQLGYDGFDGNPNNLGYDLPQLPYSIDPSPIIPPHHFEPTDNYWYSTAPWDKERNFRERKAELHYVAGGVAIDEQAK